MELILPVRWRDPAGNRIRLDTWLLVNNFCGHFLEGLSVYRKEDRDPIVQQRPEGSLAAKSRSVMQHMSSDQLKQIERDMIFVKEPVAGVGIHHRRDRPNGFDNYAHLVARKNKFSPELPEPEGSGPVFDINLPFHRDNILWCDNEFVIPLRLLSDFFAINSEMAVNLFIRFNLEQETARLFEAISRPDDDVARRALDNNPSRLQTIFWKTPKIAYNLYAFTPRRLTIVTNLLNQLKGKRTGLQPVLHEQKLIVRQGGFGGIINFNNSGTQFEWFMILVIPELSVGHRNTNATYANEKACNIIKKLILQILKMRSQIEPMPSIMT